MYNRILFDLDGTLTDPGVGITNSVAYALEKWGIRVEDRRVLYPFIGPPLTDSFTKYYGFSHEDAVCAVEYYREYFRDKGIYENEVYPDVFEMLEKLKEKCKTVILATSKPEEFAVTILKYFDLMKYFDVVAGSTFDGSRLKKADVIRYAFDKGGINDYSNAVMIGDREHDIFGAKEVGIDSIGVLYGYGDLAELQNAGATHIARSVEEILSYI